MDTALGHSRHREARTYLVVNEPAALVWAANFGALEWHAWTSCTDQPHLPRYALIDIDPGPATSWDDVLMLARLHGTAMQHLGLAGQPKLTGRRGIQIWIPIARGPSFDDTRSWTRQLSRAVGAAVPELVSWEWAVADRGGLARLDYTQNALNKTLVAPYSPRAAAGAAVSAPIDWDELDDPSLRRLPPPPPPPPLHLYPPLPSLLDGGVRAVEAPAAGQVVAEGCGDVVPAMSPGAAA